jgi:hypothetical protein
MFGPDGEAALIRAVRDVAERSFFAFAEPCDDVRFAALVDGVNRWYCASIQFEEAHASGMVDCLLSDRLAGDLFDAFSGRHHDDPEPQPAAMADLLGEFANQVCGAWLTRAANRLTFTLRTPRVTVASGSAFAPDENAVTLTLNDRPLAVRVRPVVREGAA